MPVQDPTTNYAWALPDEGGDVGAWGAMLRTIIGDDATGLDAVIKGVSNVANAALPKAGGTMTGNLLATDNLYDIGASGATRFRDLFLSRNAVIGGTAAITGAVTLSSTLAVGGNISLTANAGLIQGTSDGADSRYIILAGGGAASDSRGAYFLLHGNEAAGAEGQVAYVAGNAPAGHHVFYTGASVERARIASGGQITTTMALGNTYGLQVSNDHATLPYGIGIAFGGGAPNDATREFLGCNDTGGPRAIIRSNGGLANYSANNANLSDSRVKSQERPLLESQWSVIENLKVRKYKYLDQAHDDWNYGLIAQEVLAVDGHFVDEDSWKAKDGTALMSLYEADIHYAHIRVTQELQERVKALEAKLH